MLDLLNILAFHKVLFLFFCFCSDPVSLQLWLKFHVCVLYLCTKCKVRYVTCCVVGTLQSQWCLRLIERGETQHGIYELFDKCVGSLRDKKGQKHKGSEVLKKKIVFEKMIKDAAVTFLPSIRQQNKKTQTESQSSDFIQMSLSASRGIFEYHNTICRSPAVN